MELEEELRRLLDELRLALVELEHHSVAASQAEAAYKVEYAKAVLISQRKTLKERECDAQVVTEELLFQRLASDRQVTIAREKLGAIRASLDAVRSLMVNARTEAATSVF